MKFVQVIGTIQNLSRGIEIFGNIRFVNLENKGYFTLGVENIGDEYLVLLFTDEPGEEGLNDTWIVGRCATKPDAITEMHNILYDIMRQNSSFATLVDLKAYFDSE